MPVPRLLWARPLLFTLALTILAGRGDAQCPGGMQGSGQPASSSKIRAVVSSSIDSPTYNALAKNLEVSKSPQAGLLGASAYDVLIFDGKQLLHRLDKENLKNSIRDSLESGHWVLGLDLTERQKVDYFGSVVKASTRLTDSFYLVHRVTEPNGRYSWRIIGSHPIPKTADLTDSANLARMLYKDLTNSEPDSPPRTLKSVASMPSGLPSTSWYFCVGGNPLTLPQPQLRSNAQSQVYTMQLNDTVTEYYDDVTTPSQPFQWLVIQTDFILNPTNSTNYFANRTYNEQAFTPIQVVSTLTPETPSDFGSVSYSSPFPQPPPGQSAEWEYSAGNSGMVTSFTFQSALPSATQLKFDQSNDCNDETVAWWDCEDDDPNPGYPKKNGPNQFSLVEETYSTVVTYQTNSVLESQELLNSNVSTAFLDMWLQDLFDHNFTETWAQAGVPLYVDMSSCTAASCTTSSSP